MFEEIKNNLFVGDLYLYLLDGLKVTLLVSIISLMISFILGLILAIIKTSKKDLNPSYSNPKDIILNVLNKLANLFITIIRGTPTTIQLLIMFNVILVDLDNLMIVAIATFSLNSAAYMSEVIRGGLESVNKGEIEAARSLGLSYGQALMKVSLPQALRNALPALGNEVITLLKETSITGFIGLADLTRGASIIISKTFKASVPYFAAALIYLIIVIGIEKAFNKIEERMKNVRN